MRETMGRRATVSFRQVRVLPGSVGTAGLEFGGRLRAAEGTGYNRFPNNGQSGGARISEVRGQRYARSSVSVHQSHC